MLTQHFRPLAEQGVGWVLLCGLALHRPLGRGLRRSAPLAGHLPIICSHAVVSILWELSQLSFGSRISTEKR